MSFRKGFARCVAGFVFLAASHGVAAAQEASPNDAARFLAGLEPAADSPIAPLARDGNWRRYAASFDEAWSKLEQRQLSKVNAWSQAHLKAPPRTLYYLFSGPDFLYANAFFPNATTYLMAGLEPVGPIPRVSAATVRALPKLRSSIASALQWSFFRTKDMKTQLREGQLVGTLPIIYVYLARSGKTIHEVSLVNLDAEGAVQPAESLTRSGARGAKIVFSSGDGPRQTLYYFTTDLSDGGIKSSGFLTFASTLGEGDALLKSASYLMHGGGFNRVRDFIVSRSSTLVQDDSGIPISAFPAKDWALYPFGAYLGPVALFPNKHQPRLASLHRTGNPPKLQFGIGYRWRGHDSNLLLAMRKDGSEPQVAALPPEPEQASAPPRKKKKAAKRQAKTQREASADDRPTPQRSVDGRRRSRAADRYPPPPRRQFPWFFF